VVTEGDHAFVFVTDLRVSMVTRGDHATPTRQHASTSG
jgi:hypothetical protein